MNTAERTRIAFTHGIPDRVPVHCWLGLPYIREHLKPKNMTMTETLEWWIDDPLASLVKWQEDLGLDPMITTYSQHVGGQEIWPRMLLPRPLVTENWEETIEVVERGPGWRKFEHRIKTPAGELDYNYRVEDGYGTATDEYPLRGANPEKKLEAFRYFPAAEHYDMSILSGMVEKVGDNAWWLHHIPGPWDMATHVRGLVDISIDLKKRPQFVHDLMRVCTDWLKPMYRRLGETGIHSISMNETWVGVGLSPTVYKEFIKPYDEEAVQAAHEGGYLVSFHNCGRGTRFLEDMVDTGPDALETITSKRTSGDFDLADVKKRVGDRVCLFGGFYEHILKEDDPELVRAEVRRCIDAAAAGGGYVLRSTGQIFHANPGMIEAMCDEARQYGRYN